MIDGPSREPVRVLNMLCPTHDSAGADTESSSGTSRSRYRRAQALGWVRTGGEADLASMDCVLRCRESGPIRACASDANEQTERRWNCTPAHLFGRLHWGAPPGRPGQARSQTHGPGTAGPGARTLARILNVCNARPCPPPAPQSAGGAVPVTEVCRPDSRAEMSADSTENSGQLPNLAGDVDAPAGRETPRRADEPNARAAVRRKTNALSKKCQAGVPLQAPYGRPPESVRNGRCDGDRRVRGR